MSDSSCQKVKLKKRTLRGMVEKLIFDVALLKVQVEILNKEVLNSSNETKTEENK